ncbi:hypothetical protein HaLaN_13190 [Haematococcus lacustris]|uniref:Uncharacterized protein n=1 Tax=Haematococcus lacustris TaxID=44745 RepID=A0A699Z2D9_HAELA|nr:hypothetical protein HaLaN_13190 [Haematococcus lacustris]
MGQELMEVFERCGSADQQAQLLDRVLTSPQLPVAVQQAMQQCPTTKQRVACLLLDRVQLLMDSGTCGKKGGQHTDDVTARRVLARLVPPELLEQQLVSAFAQQTGLDRHWVSEAARQNLEQRACIEDRVDSLRHFAAVRSPDNRGHQGISQAVFDFIRHHYHERSKPSPSCKDQRSYWVCLTTGDDTCTLVKETRRFFESSLLVMWREFDDEQQHLEDQHQQGGHQLPPAAAIAAPLATPLAAVGAAPQLPPHQGGDAPPVAEEEDESLTAAASPYIDPLGEFEQQEHRWQAEQEPRERPIAHSGTVRVPGSSTWVPAARARRRKRDAKIRSSALKWQLNSHQARRKVKCPLRGGSMGGVTYTTASMPASTPALLATAALT